MYIKVHVKPDAKKELFKQTSSDHFEVSVREPAERNLANRRVVELMARYFKVPAGKARLISGHRSPSKIISIN